MKLFYTSPSCSLSPHIVLREAGLVFSMEKVDLAQKITESGADYMAINPKGQVAALVLDDGSLLTEGVAIVLYLADRVPDRNLIPAPGNLSRYRAVEWLTYIATELHKGIAPLFNPKTPDEYKTMVREKMESQFSYLDSVLEKQHYLLGQSFSVADAYLFTMLFLASLVQFDLKKYAHLSAYYERVAARPAVEATLRAEGLK